MGENIRIIQLSDMHISSTDITRNGANIRSNFLKALSKIKEIEHDFIVLSGDLGHDIDDNDYVWLKQQMKGLQYFVIPGNHDISQIMASVFGQKKNLIGDKIFYKKNIKGRNFIFADTSLEWLDLGIMESFIDRSSQKDNTFVFMHHPPTLCNARHMDTYYPLGNHAEAKDFFNKCPQINHVFCGHYHTAHHIELENFSVHIGPSTWYQIGRKPKKFNIRHSRPGYTIIDISDSGVRVKNHFLK